jgi:hypothetical protein
MKNTSNYQIKTEDDKLIFTTSSFIAEKTSVLHSGVYTREFSSMLFASAVSIFFYMGLITVNINPVFFRYILIVLVFVAGFLAANKFIFKEKKIEVILDNSIKTAIITRFGIISKKKENIAFENIRSVELRSRKFTPENMDGIKFVQQISAQHGSAMPELSEEEEFITLSLSLADGSDRVIYAAKIDGGKVDGEPTIPVNEIKNFLNI